jgi:hypothetical protein
LTRRLSRGTLAGASLALAGLAAVLLHARESGLYSRTLPPDPPLDVRIWTVDRAEPSEEVCVLGVVRARHGTPAAASARIEVGFPGCAETGWAETDPSGVFLLLLPPAQLPSDQIRITVCRPGAATTSVDLNLRPVPAPVPVPAPSAVSSSARVPSVRVIHESGVPVPGVPNRYLVMTLAPDGRPASREAVLTGFGREERRLRTGAAGWVLVEWDPATAGGYASHGFAAGPVARIRTADGEEVGFDPMRPRPDAPEWWRPDAERAVRGADGPARFLLRPEFDPGPPAGVRASFAAPATGGRYYLFGWRSGRMLFSRDFDDPGTDSLRIDLPPLAREGVLELRALRVFPDGATAFDRRFLRLGPEDPAAAAARSDGSAPAVRTLSTWAAAVAEHESSVLDREEEYRVFHHRLLGVVACAAGLGVVALVWVGPGLCLRRRWGRRSAIAWWLAVPAAVAGTVHACAGRWLPSPWRGTAALWAVAAIAVGAAWAYGAGVRHTRWAWVGVALLGLAVAALVACRP